MHLAPRLTHAHLAPGRIKALSSRHAFGTEVRDHVSMMRFDPGTIGPLMDRWLDLPSRVLRDWLGDLPPVDLSTEDGRLVARVEVPGIDPAHLEVTVHDNALTIRGEEASAATDDQGRYGQRARSFRRTVALPLPVRAQDAEATCRHGVLQVVMPLKEPERQGHRIPIRWQETSH
jgi:HSP20 family protein